MSEEGGADSEPQYLPDIARVEISVEEIQAYTDEDDFNALAVSLTIEFGAWVCVAASLLPGETRRWNRNQAILGGLLVRYYKLLSALLDQTCQRRRETSFMLARLVFECMVTIQYLLMRNSDELYQAFVAYSLQHERKLREHIQQNIDRRGGESLPIERRMIASIDRTFSVSGITIDQATKATARPWKDANIFERTRAVGLEQAYLLIFGGTSHSVHGNWQDLLEYHLEKEEDGFRPELRWQRPRPQVLYTLCLLGISAVQQYLVFLVGEDAESVCKDLDELRERIRTVNSLHEEFLIRKSENEGN